MSKSIGSGQQRDRRVNRTIKACNRCRQRKSRCDGDTPCSVCEKHGAECVYEASQRRRGPGKSKEYIRALEARLQEATKTERVAPHPGHVQDAEGTTAAPAPDKLHAVAGDATHHAAADTSGPELTSSVISDGTSRLLMKPSTVIADEPGNGNSNTSTSLASMKLGTSGDGVKPLASVVPTNYIIKILEPIFDDMYSGYPFLSWPVFVDELRRYDLIDNVPWRALLTSVMAMAMLFRPPTADFASSAEGARAEFRHAYALLSRIIAMDPDILAVEALLAMALFAKTTSDARTAAQLLSSAVVMYQMLALQNDPSRTLTLGTDDERHRRAFWTAYILDSEMCVHSGLPPAIDDDEFGVVAERAKMGAHMQRLTPALQARAELAVAEKVVYKQVYQRKAFGQLLDRELVSNIVHMNFTLGYWPRTVSPDLRPDLDNPLSLSQPRPEMDALLCSFAFFNCVSMIHWAARRHGSRNGSSGSAPSEQAEATQVASSIKKSRKAALATLGLLPALTGRPFVEIWRILCYPLSASVALLAGVLEDPLSASAWSDIRAIETFGRYLEGLIRDDGYDLRLAHQACLRMEEMARDAVRKAEGTLMTQYTDELEGAAIPELLEDLSGGTDQRKLADLLVSCTHPMYVAQGLMTNMQNRDSAATTALSRALGIAGGGGRSPRSLVPECFWPKTTDLGSSV
ncbi:hypothetical protein F5Y14DRAFT_431811 [Nemania sp. NC0429]|nr:hypothetical protein F5Y14DRAFT_431811 [Nemania sp. NC0429]